MYLITCTVQKAHLNHDIVSYLKQKKCLYWVFLCLPEAHSQFVLTDNNSIHLLTYCRIILSLARQFNNNELLASNEEGEIYHYIGDLLVNTSQIDSSNELSHFYFTKLIEIVKLIFFLCVDL